MKSPNIPNLAPSYLKISPFFIIYGSPNLIYKGRNWDGVSGPSDYIANKWIRPELEIKLVSGSPTTSIFFHSKLGSESYKYHLNFTKTGFEKIPETNYFLEGFPFFVFLGENLSDGIKNEIELQNESHILKYKYHLIKTLPDDILQVGFELFIKPISPKFREFPDIVSGHFHFDSSKMVILNTWLRDENPIINKLGHLKIEYYRVKLKKYFIGSEY